MFLEIGGSFKRKFRARLMWIEGHRLNRAVMAVSVNCVRVLLWWVYNDEISLGLVYEVCLGVGTHGSFYELEGPLKGDLGLL